MMEENQNLENFMKKRLDSAEFAYREEDWLALEAKLDAPIPILTRPKTWKNTVLLLLSLLLIGTLSFLAGWYLKPIANKATNSEVMERKEDSSDFSGSTLSGTSSMDLLQEQFQNTITDSNKVYATAETSKTATILDAKLLDGGQMAYTNPQGDELQQFNSIKAIQFMTVPSSGDRSYQLNLGPEILASEVTQVSSQPLYKPWSLMVGYAPELVSIGFANHQTYTSKFGAGVIYQLSERWSMSTGLHYSTKAYIAPPEAYHPPEGYWRYQNQGRKPVEIFGSCAILDIPVKANFKVLDWEKLDVHISTGISSYLILNEHYRFEYTMYMSQNAPYWSTNKSSISWAGIGNISVILEVPTSPRSSLMIEPYFQPPIKPIGWGKVAMYSSGMMVSYRYKL